MRIGLLTLLFIGCATTTDKEKEFGAQYKQAMLCKALCDASSMSVASWEYAGGLTGRCVCAGSIPVDAPSGAKE